MMLEEFLFKLITSFTDEYSVDQLVETLTKDFNVQFCTRSSETGMDYWFEEQKGEDQVHAYDVSDSKERAIVYLIIGLANR